MPLAEGSHAEVTAYAVENGALLATLIDGKEIGLRDPEQFVGYRGERECARRHPARQQRPAYRARDRPQAPIGRDDPAGIADVDARIGDHDDHGSARTASPPSMPKTRSLVYRNWLGLMNGNLVGNLRQGRKEMIERKLNPDRVYTGAGRRRGDACPAAA